MKFGDIVINKWAGDGNPHKVLMVVSHGKMINCLSTKGRKVQFYNDKDLDLKKIGEVDFSEWIAKSNEFLNVSEDE